MELKIAQFTSLRVSAYPVTKVRSPGSLGPGNGGFSWNQCRDAQAVQMASTVPLCYADLLLLSSFGAHVHKITNGRGIYLALCIMILMWANPLLGPL